MDGDVDDVTSLSLGEPLELCSSCHDLKQEVKKLKDDSTINYSMLKEKIISTDLLIKKYRSKCEDYDIQAKKLEVAFQTLEKSERDSRALDTQVKSSLVTIEPLRQAMALLETENRLKAGEIEQLRVTLHAAENTRLQYEQLSKSAAITLTKYEEEKRDIEKKRQLLAASQKKNESMVVKLKDECHQQKRELVEIKKHNESLEMQLVQALQETEKYGILFQQQGNKSNALDIKPPSSIDVSILTDIDAEDEDSPDIMWTFSPVPFPLSPLPPSPMPSKSIPASGGTEGSVVHASVVETGTQRTEDNTQYNKGSSDIIDTICNKFQERFSAKDYDSIDTSQLSGSNSANESESVTKRYNPMENVILSTRHKMDGDTINSRDNHCDETTEKTFETDKPNDLLTCSALIANDIDKINDKTDTPPDTMGIALRTRSKSELSSCKSPVPEILPNNTANVEDNGLQNTDNVSDDERSIELLTISNSDKGTIESDDVVKKLSPSPDVKILSITPKNTNHSEASGYLSLDDKSANESFKNESPSSTFFLSGTGTDLVYAESLKSDSLTDIVSVGSLPFEKSGGLTDIVSVGSLPSEKSGSLPDIISVGSLSSEKSGSLTDIISVGSLPSEKSGSSSPLNADQVTSVEVHSNDNYPVSDSLTSQCVLLSPKQKELFTVSKERMASCDVDAIQNNTSVETMEHDNDHTHPVIMKTEVSLKPGLNDINNKQTFACEQESPMVDLANQHSDITNVEHATQRFSQALVNTSIETVICPVVENVSDSLASKESEHLTMSSQSNTNKLTSFDAIVPNVLENYDDINNISKYIQENTNTSDEPGSVLQSAGSPLSDLICEVVAPCDRGTNSTSKRPILAEQTSLGFDHLFADTDDVITPEDDMHIPDIMIQSNKGQKRKSSNICEDPVNKLDDTYSSSDNKYNHIPQIEREKKQKLMDFSELASCSDSTSVIPKSDIDIMFSLDKPLSPMSDLSHSPFLFTPFEYIEPISPLPPSPPNDRTCKKRGTVPLVSSPDRHEPSSPTSRTGLRRSADESYCDSTSSYSVKRPCKFHSSIPEGAIHVKPLASTIRHMASRKKMPTVSEKHEATPPSVVKMQDSKHDLQGITGAQLSANSAVTKYVYQEVENFSRSSCTSSKNVIEKMFSHEDPLIVLPVLVEVMVKILYSDLGTTDLTPIIYASCCKEETINSPFLSDLEAKFIILLLDLKAKYVEMFPFEMILPILTRSITSVNCCNKTCCNMSSCRLFTALCRIEGNLERVRTFVYDVMQHSHLSRAALVFSVAVVWPLVFRRSSTGTSSIILIYEYYFTKISGTKKHQKHIKQMLHCLKKLCAWSAEAPEDVNKLLINLMKELKVALKGAAPANNAYDIQKSIELLRVTEGWPWAYRFIVQSFLQTQIKYWSCEELRAITDLTDTMITCFLRMLGNLCINCPLNLSRNVENVIQTTLTPLLENNSKSVSVDVQTCSADVMMLLSPYQPRHCLKCLQNWTVCQKDSISDEMRERVINVCRTLERKIENLI